MPMETTSVNALPVTPFLLRVRMEAVKAWMRSSTLCTAGTTSTPSMIALEVAGARSAMCPTARSSVMFKCAPAAMAWILDLSPAASASASSSWKVSAVARCREKSSRMPSNSAVSVPERSASCRGAK